MLALKSRLSDYDGICELRRLPPARRRIGRGAARGRAGASSDPPPWRREPSATGAAAASHGTRRQRGHVCFHSRIAESASTWQRKKAQARELSERGIVSELRALSALPFYRSLSALPPACPALSLTSTGLHWLACTLGLSYYLLAGTLVELWSILKLTQIWMFRTSFKTTR